MDAQTCTKILWIVTRDFSPDSGNSPDLLTQARATLARAIFATDGKGFPKAAEPPQDALGSTAWAGCMDAALNASETRVVDTDPVRYVLLAPEGGDGKPNTQSPNLGITWPATSTPRIVTGPVLDGSNRRVRLFGYSTIDQRQAMGESGLGDIGLYPIHLRNRGPGDAVGTTGQRPASAGAWAWMLFVAAIVSGSFSMIWIYGASELIHNAANELLTFVRVQPPPKPDGNYVVLYHNQPISELAAKIASAEKPSSESAAVVIPPSEEKAADELNKVNCLLEIQTRLNASVANLNTKNCNVALLSAWVKKLEDLQSGKTTHFWTKSLAFFGKASNFDGRLSMFWPLVLTQLAIILLAVSAGLAKRGHAYGSLVDERNRISLSSLQQLLWTVVLFGGFTILGVFNIALLADFVRDASQGAAIAATDASAQVSRDFVGFFPSMDPALWAVLGVTVVVSPYLSKRILVGKESGLGGGGFDSVEARQVQSEPLDRRASTTEALWTDLFTGEAKSDADHVDVSRLQHLVITGLLLGGYLVMLVEYSRSLDADAILLALLTGSPVFASMPPVDFTFVGLLALSHAGYLAFKALPSSGAPGNAVR